MPERFEIYIVYKWRYINTFSFLNRQPKQVLDLATPERCKAKLTYVTWKRTGWDLNLRSVNRKSNALPQRQHASACLFKRFFFNNNFSFILFIQFCCLLLLDAGVRCVFINVLSCQCRRYKPGARERTKTTVELHSTCDWESISLTCWSTPTASSPVYMMFTQPSLDASTNNDISAFRHTTQHSLTVKYTSICIAHFYAKRLKCAQTWITQDELA